MLRSTLTGLAFAVLAFTWAVGLTNYAALPATIPTHFDLSGAPNGYGSKFAVLIVPAFAAVLFSVLALTQRMNPRWYSYPFTIRADALPFAFEYTRTLIASTNVLAMAVFAILEVALVRGAAENHLSDILALNWVVLGIGLAGFCAYVAALVPFRARG